jgi:hypothetical protein
LAKGNLTKEKIKNNFLLATNSEVNTAWRLAALNINTFALQKLLDLAKENLPTEEIKIVVFSHKQWRK